jgi:hypothetical protein
MSEAMFNKTSASEACRLALDTLGLEAASKDVYSWIAINFPDNNYNKQTLATALSTARAVREGRPRKQRVSGAGKTEPAAENGETKPLDCLVAPDLYQSNDSNDSNDSPVNIIDRLVAVKKLVEATSDLGKVARVLTALAPMVEAAGGWHELYTAIHQLQSLQVMDRGECAPEEDSHAEREWSRGEISTR